MKDGDFQKLMESVRQMSAILRGGEDLPHRRATVEKIDARALRDRMGLTQAALSQIISVSIRTLRNWEQGRRAPEGPARALLRVAEKEPEAVLNALHS